MKSKMQDRNTEGRRFSDEHVMEWRETGFVLIEDFFRDEEIAPVVRDYETMYGDRRNEAVPDDAELKGKFNEQTGPIHRISAGPGLLGQEYSSQQRPLQLRYHTLRSLSRRNRRQRSVS